MKKFLFILLGLIIAFVAGLSFLFYQTIDEESYKSQIIASTKELTGADMTIGGIQIKLFPTPVIRLENVAIQNKPGFASSDFLRIATVEAHIQFASLFKNPLIVENIILNKPELFLEKNGTGDNSWALKFLKPTGKAISQDDLLGQTFSNVPPQFQNMQLVDGRISYTNAITGIKRELTEVKGKVTSSSITGPFDFVGSVKDKSMPLDVSMHVNKLNVTSATEFSLSLLNPGSKAVLSIQKAKIEKLADPGQTFSGPFTFQIPRLSTFLRERMDYKDLPEPLNKPILGTGNFSISAKEAAFTNVAARYGEDNVENALALDATFIYPTVAGQPIKVTSLVRFSHLNLDTFLPYIPEVGSWENWLSLSQTKLPSDFDFVLNAEKLTLRKGMLKDVAFSAARKDNQINLRQVQATLPEKTFLDGQGEASLAADNPYINMMWIVESSEPQATFTWLDLKSPIKMDWTAVRDIKATAQMRVRPKDLTLDKMNVSINGGQLTGGVVVALTEVKPTGYAKLILNGLNLDDFFAYQAPTQERSLKSWIEESKKDLEVSPLLSDVDVMFNITARDITFKGLPMEQAMYEGKIEGNNWITSRLNIEQAAQSNIEYRGTVQKLADGSLYFKDIQFSLEMPKSMLLLDRLKIQSPIPGNVSKVSVKGTVTGSFEKFSGLLDVGFTQGRIRAEGSVENLLGTAPSYNMVLKMAHPNFHQFVRMFNPSFTGLSGLSGSFSFEGAVKGAPDMLSLSKADISVGAQKIQTDLDLVRTENGVTVKGNISSPYLYLDKFMSNKSLISGVNARTGKSEFSNQLLNFDALNNLSLDVNLAAEKMALGKVETNLFKSHVTLDEKILTIENTKANIGGGSFDLSATLNCSTATPFVKGSMKGDKIPVRADLLTLGLFRLKSGDASWMLDFDTKGNSINDMVNVLSSTGRFAIQNGAISSLNLNTFERRVQATIARRESLEGMTTQLNKELTVGETAFDSLEGSYAITDGIFRTSDTVLKTPNASAIMQTNFDMPDWSLTSSIAITLKSFTGYPPISVVIKGVAHNPQTNIDLAPFIKYVESTSADAKNEILRQQRDRQLLQEQLEAKDRIAQLRGMIATAEKQMNQTQKALQISSTDTMQTEFVRAKDAFALLQDLGQKPAPTPADLEKASAQAALITSRTQTILTAVEDKAAGAIVEQMKPIYDMAQEKMHAINRIQRRLTGVESVEQAYQKAFSTMTLIQQLYTFAQSTKNLDRLEEALKQSQDALDIMDLTYESIAKFDVDAGPIAVDEAPAPAPVQGRIRRSGS